MQLKYLENIFLGFRSYHFFPVHPSDVGQLKGENYDNFERPRLHCHLSFGPDFQLCLWADHHSAFHLIMAQLLKSTSDPLRPT